MKIILFLATITLVLTGFCPRLFCQDIQLQISIQPEGNGEHRIKGTVAAQGLMPRNKPQPFNTITVILEYIQSGQNFAPLPSSYNSQYGLQYDTPSAPAAAKTPAPTTQFKLLIAPLEKVGNEIQLDIDELVSIPETTTRYRILATLTQQKQGQRIEAIFKHASYGPITITTDSQNKPEQETQIKQQSESVAGEPTQPASKDNKIPMKILLMIIIVLLILLVVVTIFKKTLKTN